MKTQESKQTILNLPKNAWLLSLGFGIHLSWIAVLFYRGTFFDMTGNSPTYFVYYLASMVALTLALVCLGALKGTYASASFFSRPAPMLAFSGAAAAGTLLALFSGLDDAGRLVLFVVSVVLTGFGSSYINLVWGQNIVRQRDTQAITVLCLSYGISAMVYFAVAHLPATIAVAFSISMPVVSMLVALAYSSRAPKDTDTPVPATVDECVARDVRLFSIRIIGAAIVFGFVQGGITGLMVGDSQTLLQSHSSLFLLFLNIPLVFAVPYIESRTLQRPQSERFTLAYRVSLLAVVGALLVSNILGTPGLVLQAVILVGYTVFKIFVWSELCQISRAGSVAPARMFGYGEAGMAAALLLSNFVSNMFCGMNDNPDTVRIVITLGIAGLLITYLFILPERTVLAIDDMGKSKDGEEPHVRFQDRIDEITVAYGLTKREAEVLGMFIRGRSSSRIAEDLYISNGTVATHLRNIYRKLNVHSRQDLIDLLESTVPSQFEEIPGLV